jgi:hypothetical protein
VPSWVPRRSFALRARSGKRRALVQGLKSLAKIVRRPDRGAERRTRRSPRCHAPGSRHFYKWWIDLGARLRVLARRTLPYGRGSDWRSLTRIGMACRMDRSLTVAALIGARLHVAF